MVIGYGRVEIATQGLFERGEASKELRFQSSFVRSHSKGPPLGEAREDISNGAATEPLEAEPRSEQGAYRSSGEDRLMSLFFKKLKVGSFTCMGRGSLLGVFLAPSLL